jgi:hypothetical protein
MVPARTRMSFVAGLLALSALGAAAQDRGALATYRNDRHGFSLSYPADAFTPATGSVSDDGRLFVSQDGRARLLAGAIDNADRLELLDYRSLLLQQSYAGADIDYAPVSGSWFVLSGTRNDVMFYERVTFTCGGRRINSWAMLYPAAERRLWDRVVEQVARSYRAGKASCG